MRRILMPFAAALAVASSSNAQTTPSAPPAASAPAPSTTTPPGDSRTTAEPTFLAAKWKGKLYGFAELDTIYDTTQSFTEVVGNAKISGAPNTLAGENGRFLMSARNSRIGFALESPEYNGMKGSGTIELDFFGAANGTADASVFNSPTFRMRHAWLKLQTPVVDILAGQTWSLLGGSAAFLPASVELQGMVGEIYQRISQLRVGKTIAMGDSKVEVQVAAQRPYNKDYGMPDFAGMIRLELPFLTGFKASGGNGGGLSGLQVAVSGVYRNLKYIDPTGCTATACDPTKSNTTTAGAVAADVILPLIPATKTSRANALTVVAEGATGSGWSDALQSYTTGVPVGTPGALPTGATGATYTSNNFPLDANVAGFKAGSNELGAVAVQSMFVNLQYFLPIDNGNVFFSGLYSLAKVTNAADFFTGGTAGAKTVVPDVKRVSGAVFWDVTPAVRTAFELAHYRQTYYGSDTRSQNRGQLSFWYTF